MTGTCGPDGHHRAPIADVPTACPCGTVTRHPAPVKETPLLTVRGILGFRPAHLPLLTVECVLCGRRAAFLAPGDRAAVDHLCGRGIVGPSWTLTQPPTAPRRHEPGGPGTRTPAERGPVTSERNAA